MDRETKLALADRLDFSALTLDDLTILDGNKHTFVKYLKAYRFALVLQKIESVGEEDMKLVAQINLLTTMVNEIDTNIERKRNEAIKTLIKEEEE